MGPLINLYRTLISFGSNLQIPLLLLVAALIVLAAGPGKASVDALLTPKFKKD